MTESSMRARQPRFPCVGIALLYSARDDRAVPELGSFLHQVATRDMSLNGLSFDVSAPLEVGQLLMVLVGQPATRECEHLQTRVRWCRQEGRGHYRAGVEIERSQPVSRDLPALARYDQVQRGLPVPASVELVCPACGAHAVFELVANQPVDPDKGLMPLYDCSICETTRSIMGLLAYARRQVLSPLGGKEVQA